MPKHTPTVPTPVPAPSLPPSRKAQAEHWMTTPADSEGYRTYTLWQWRLSNSFNHIGIAGYLPQTRQYAIKIMVPPHADGAMISEVLTELNLFLPHITPVADLLHKGDPPGKYVKVFEDTLSECATWSVVDYGDVPHPHCGHRLVLYRISGSRVAFEASFDRWDTMLLYLSAHHPYTR